MSLLASETQNKVAACRTALVAVERQLDPLLARDPKEVSRQLAALENAELQVGLAFTVASLYFCHLLTQGVDPSDHPIKQELDRIQLYFKKIRSTVEEANMKNAMKERRQIDTDAAKRMVQHYTNAAEAAIQKKNEIMEESKSRPLLPVGEKPAGTLTARKKRRLQQQTKCGEPLIEPKETPAEIVSHSTPTQIEKTNVESPKKGVTKEPIEVVSLPNETSPRKKARRAAASQAGTDDVTPETNASSQLTRSCGNEVGTANTAAASVNQPSKTDAELMPPPRTRKVVRKRRKAPEGTGAAPAVGAAAGSDAGPDECVIS